MQNRSIDPQQEPWQPRLADFPAGFSRQAGVPSIQDSGPRAEAGSPVRRGRWLGVGALALAGLAGCLNSGTPFAPSCTPVIGIELSSDDIQPGDTFVATAVHRGDECLGNLSWSASGVVNFRAAEASSATFLATESGTGRIRVLNDEGSIGILDVEVAEDEEGGPAPRP